MKHIKKLLAILLSLCMLCGLCTFAMAETELVLDKEIVLTAGTSPNRITLSDNSVITVFEFIPTESGVYRFSLTTATAKLYTVDGSKHYMFNPVEQTTRKFEKEVKESYVNAPILVGIMARGNVSLKIERIGDASFDENAVPYGAYVTTENLTKFTMPADVTLTYVDVTKPHSAVKGDDGYYHLDNKNGPVLYINMGSNAPYASIAAAASNGNMKTTIPDRDGVKGENSYTDKNGVLLEKIEFITCINEYNGYTDNSTNTWIPGYTDVGVYPLTDDMVYIMQTYTTYSGWNDSASPNYLFMLDDTTPQVVDKDTAWMFCVGYDAEQLPGGKKNPHQIGGNSEITVAAGDTTYLSVLDKDGLIMKVTGASGFTVDGTADTAGAYQAVVSGDEVQCVLKNTTAAAQTYSIVFNIPLGAPSNPETITRPGDYTAPLTPGNEDGYTYSYTATDEGYIEISSRALYAINGTTSDVDSTRLDVIPGDVVKITVFGNADTNWSLSLHVHQWEDASCLRPKTCSCSATKGDPAPHDYATDNGICHGVNLAEGEECESDIRILLIEDNNAIQVAPGETAYYYGNFGGKNATLVGNNVTIAHNGNTYPVTDSVVFPAVGNPFNPSIFAITNTGTENGEYQLNFAFANGSKNAPELLTEGGSYTAQFTGGATDYYYNFTAAADSTVTVTMIGSNWQYVINNNTAAKYGDTHWCDDDPLVSTEAVEVVVGDVVEIMVAYYDPTFATTPSAIDWKLDIHTHSWSTETCANDTTCSGCDVTKPAPAHNYQNGVCAACGDDARVRLLEVENEITVAVGETVYYVGFFRGMYATLIGNNVTVVHDGQTHVVTDSVTFFTAGDPTDTRNPNVFAVTNTGDTDGVYQFNFVYPLGAKGNPEAMDKDGTYSIDLEEGNSGYYYSYTAPGNGTVTVTMLTKDNWQYVVNNIDGFFYGDTHRSDDDPVVTSQEVTVREGEQVEIMVSTVDPANQWNAPAGTIKISVAFTEGAGEPDNESGGGAPGAPQPDDGKDEGESDSKPDDDKHADTKPGDTKPDNDKPGNTDDKDESSDEESTTPDAPATDDEENEGGKEEPEPNPLGIDLDGDGKVDMLIEDGMLIETDGGMGIDLNGDGVVDAMVLDLDNDGIYDGLDIDYDGVVDFQIFEIVTENPNASENNGSGNGNTGNGGATGTSPVTGESATVLPYVLAILAAAVLFGTTLRKRNRA